MGAEKTPLQKTYEISVGQDSLDVEFIGSNRQLDWLEISIVHDKSDRHTTIYDCYNRELAAQIIKLLRFHWNLQLEKWKKYDVDYLTERHLLSSSKQFVAWNCNGSIVAPLTEYMNNPIFQELPDEDKYFSVTNDDRISLDLRATSGYLKEAEKLERNNSEINLDIMLKTATTKKLTVRI